MQTITLLLIGFSVLSAGILLFAYTFFLGNLGKTVSGQVACAVLLTALAGLQLGHLEFLRNGTELFGSRIYVFLLLTTPPAFFFFSREILLPDARRSWKQMVHLAPLVASFFVPVGIIAPIAFVIGTGYAIWFTRIVFGLRRHMSRFRFEVFFFGLFALLAALVLILGLLLPWIDASVFYVSYANFIGIALLLITGALIVFPELLQDISDAASLSYAASRLGDVDTAAKIGELERLMDEEKLFRNENLNLAACAAALDLSAHQLSELVNTQFGRGFSRYIREQRVADAQQLLRDEPDTPVLAIGLSAGFRSQSNFYAAFREIAGQTPGAYRKSVDNR